MICEGPMMGGMMGGFMLLILWAAFTWFIIFTILVVVKLDKISKLLEKK